MATQSIGNRPAEQNTFGRLTNTFVRMLTGRNDIQLTAGLSIVASAQFALPLTTFLLPSIGLDVGALLTYTTESQICFTMYAAVLGGAGFLVSAGVGAQVDVGPEGSREGARLFGDIAGIIALPNGFAFNASAGSEGVGGGGARFGPGIGVFAGARGGIISTGCARGALAVPNAIVRSTAFLLASPWYMGEGLIMQEKFLSLTKLGVYYVPWCYLFFVGIILQPFLAILLLLLYGYIGYLLERKLGLCEVRKFYKVLIMIVIPVIMMPFFMFISIGINKLLGAF